MARQETVSCDVCGTVGVATGDWFVAGIAGKQGIFILGKESFDHSPARGDAKENFDLCGQSCVLKKVSELIGSWK